MKPALFMILMMLLYGCHQVQNNHSSDSDSSDHITSNVALYSLPGEYRGLVQSPVNIMTSDLEKETDHEIEVIHPHCPVIDIVNTGHTVQLDFGPGTFIIFEGIDYELKQVHFHTPSEHHIDGITYPMEIHYVSIGHGAGEENKYLVIAALFKMGKSNKFIAKFLDMIPETAGDTVRIENEFIYLDDLEKPSHPDTYDWFHYDGSLTTVPYTETVNWLVMKDILEASAKEIFTINTLEGNNARHIQALYHRKVEE